jgi:hypothetical protein
MKVGSSKFNLTHERKFSCNFGQLIPIMCEDVIPGDRFSNTTEIFLRLAPQRAPVMHRCSVSTHFFFVPNRLLWRTTQESANGHGKPHNGWERFITGYDPDDLSYIDPKDEIEPQLGINYSLSDVLSDQIPDNRKPGVGTIFDYLYGLPPMEGNDKNKNPRVMISALPLRAYNLIFNEWYRDEDLQIPVNISFRSNDKESDFAAGMYKGLDTYTDAAILYRCFEKDYFTSCRPSPQKGPEMIVPLGNKAPVKFQSTGKGTVLLSGDSPSTPFPAKSIGAVGWSNETADPQGGADFMTLKGLTKGSPEYLKYLQEHDGEEPGAVTAQYPVALDPKGTLYTDLQQATGSTINKLRIAFQTQKFLERNARAGARYVEQILSHFGVRSPDFRLDRPEFLGGGRSSIMFSEVLQTNSPTGGALKDVQPPLGTMAGHGFSAAKNHGFSHSFTEHGWIIGIMSVMPRTAYQQGVPKRFSRRSRYDYFFPEFSHLGEQAVLSKEIYVVDDLADSGVTTEMYNPDRGTYDTVFIKKNDVPFGFQAIWDEYRKRESSVHGAFRGDLSYWHMGRIFTDVPTLTSDFVHFQEGQTSQRVWGVQKVDPCWVQLVNHLHAIRKMPAKGIPGMLDHF